MSLPTIAALWMYGPLSFLEQLCLKSFVDNGHRVILYHYGPLENVPDGMELADANEILPQTNFLKHERTGSPALHSDLFRYKMLEKSRNTIWADTDAYCVKPFVTPNGHFYGWESAKHINGGVLGLPADSDTLQELLAYTEDEFAIPSWYGEEYQAELEQKRAEGNPVHASEQPWGVWGPHAITHFLHKTGEVKYALPREALYPISFKDRRKMLRRNFDTTGYITENTFSIHLYGRRMRARLVEKEGGAPHPRSLLGKLLIKHGIDPAKAPLPVKKPAPEADVIPTSETQAATAPRPDASKEVPRTIVPVVEIKPAVEKAPQPQPAPKADAGRVNEALYRLILRGQTSADEVAMIGAGAAADVILSLLPEGKLHRIGPTSNPRIIPVPGPLTDAIGQFGDPSVIVDDNSGAAAQKLQTFATLFPLMKSGGVYMIECRHDDVNDIEVLAVMRAFLDNGRFGHPDAVVQQKLRSLEGDLGGCFVISGKDKKDQTIVLHRR